MSLIHFMLKVLAYYAVQAPERLNVISNDSTRMEYEILGEGESSFLFSLNHELDDVYFEVRSSSGGDQRDVSASTHALYKTRQLLKELNLRLISAISEEGLEGCALENMVNISALLEEITHLSTLKSLA